MEWRRQDGIRMLEAQLPGARATFTTRLGGVSEGAFESLNLGHGRGDRAEAVAENRRRAGAAAGVDPEQVLSAHQVHGTTLAWHGDGSGRQPAEADGHVLCGAGLAAMVVVADCLPIAVVGPRGAAILHCGRRGLAAGILERGIAAVEAEAAAIGPGIGPCCYEVDLFAAAEEILARAGVVSVEAAGICTSCEPELFFSHRRDRGQTGRQAGFLQTDPVPAA